MDNAIVSFVHGEASDYYKIDAMLDSMRFKDCSENDFQCIDNIYNDRGGPFGDGTYLGHETIIRYAEKIRQYDPRASNTVVSFLETLNKLGQWQENKKLQEAQPAKYDYPITNTNIGADSAQEKTNINDSKKDYAVYAGLLGVIIFIAFTVFMVIKKSIKS